jgi:hypothetical protein
MEEDADDEVLAEFPVYLTKELADNLYLLQYPLRPAERSYGFLFVFCINSILCCSQTLQCGSRCAHDAG